MQGGVADSRSIRVRPQFQQQACQATVTAVRRDDKRAGTVWQCVVDIRAGGDEQPGGLGISRSGREEERRASTPGHRVVQFLPARPLRHLAGDGLNVASGAGTNIRAALQQGVHSLGMALRGGPHQRGLIVGGFLCVDLCAAREQRTHAGSLARSRARHQHRLAADACSVWIGPRLEQPVNQRSLAIQTREVQRRHARVIRDIGLGARSQQKVHRTPIVEMHGPVERRCAVALTCVDIDTLFEQSANGLDVPALHRFDQTQVTGRRDCTDRDDRD